MDASKRSFERYGDLLLILGVTAWMAGVGVYLGYWQEPDAAKWHFPDSKSYRAVGDWIFGDRVFAVVDWSVAFRPLGYPAVLGLCERMGGSVLVLVQGVAWVLSQWLVYRIIRERTGHRLMSAGIMGVSATCLSPVSLVFAALSETLAMASFVAALFFLHRFCAHRRKRDLFFMLIAAVYSALCRPSVFYPALVLGLAALVASRRQPMALALVLAAFIPLAAQIGMMHARFGICRLSTIDTHTVNNYFLARVDATGGVAALAASMDVRNREVYGAYRQSDDPLRVRHYDEAVRRELRQVLRDKPGRVLAAFGENLWYNVRRGSSSLQSVRQVPRLQLVTAWQNRVLSVGGVALALLSFGRLVWRVRSGGRAVISASDGFEAYVAFTQVYFLVMSGISFQQADRFALFSYPMALLLAGVWLARMFGRWRSSCRQSARQSAAGREVNRA